MNDIVTHIRNHNYMTGVSRSRERVKNTGEFFTPTPIVLEMLKSIPKDDIKNPDKVFYDPACGDCQFLAELVILRLKAGLSLEQILKTTFGTDLMDDNILICHDRLLAGFEELRYIVEKNIVCQDFFDYIKPKLF